MSRLVYLDNNATTCVAPEVREAMLPFLTDLWGNPCLLYTSPSPRDRQKSRMPSSA